MRVWVVGVGAVGSNLAVQLALAGHDVSVIARDRHYDAIRSQGIKVLTATSERSAKVRASLDGRDLPHPDVIFVAVKASALHSIVNAITIDNAGSAPVVFALNGLPWWYPYSAQAQSALGAGQNHSALKLGFLDPDEALARNVGIGRTIGCVVYWAGQLLRPGVVQEFAVDHRKVLFGEPGETMSARVKEIGRAFAGTEIDASIVADIGTEAWRKLVTNVAQTPVCCLTRQPMAVLGRNPELLSIAQNLMREVITTATAWGARLNIDVNTHFGSRSLTSLHKPSMLQDLEAGRPTEIDALLVAVQACARARDVATPVLDTLTALMMEILTHQAPYRQET